MVYTHTDKDHIHNHIVINAVYLREVFEQGNDVTEVMESIYTKGRDNARMPMQWNGQENAGFTTGKPWLQLNPTMQKSM